MEHLDRRTAAEQGREALAIMESGEYVAPSGRSVTIRDPLARAVEGTRNHPPGEPVPASAPSAFATRFEVTNESTIAAAIRLVDAGEAPAALNFASAKNPGGGFLGGARAQEESLARSSGLYACIVDQPMYAHHRMLRDALYTSWAIYSPSVPVFRDGEGRLLESPRTCAFITAPAVNAKVVLGRDPDRRAEVRSAMAERVSRVLGIAAANAHTSLVLGAWGCGVFGNDMDEMAELFHAAFRRAFFGAFEHVVFAILDGSEEGRFLGPFSARFG